MPPAALKRYFLFAHMARANLKLAILEIFKLKRRYLNPILFIAFQSGEICNDCRAAGKALLSKLHY